MRSLERSELKLISGGNSGVFFLACLVVVPVVGSAILGHFLPEKFDEPREATIIERNLIKANFSATMATLSSAQQDTINTYRALERQLAFFDGARSSR